MVAGFQHVPWQYHNTLHHALVFQQVQQAARDCFPIKQQGARKESIGEAAWALMKERTYWIRTFEKKMAMVDRASCYLACCQ